MRYSGMARPWQKMTVADVAPGDRGPSRARRVRGRRGSNRRSSGRPRSVCLIEDTPERWLAHPAGVTLEIEVLRSEG